MKPFLSKARRRELLGFDDRWASLFGILVVGALANTLYFGSAQADLETWMACYLIGLVFTSLYWILCRAILMAMRVRFPGQEQTSKRLIYTVALVFLTVVIVTAIGQGVDAFYGFPRVGQDSSIFKGLMSLTLCIMILGIYEGVYFFAQFRRSQLEKERLAREQMRSQLAVLRQQMNPHFLFNSLNTLVNLIPEDADRATHFTQRLAAVYRRLLDYRHQETITLAEELNALDDYVYLLRTRFEDKLRLRWYTDGGDFEEIGSAWRRVESKLPEYERFRIVPLTLQLLVENAVKHNVVSAEHPLYVDLKIGGDRIFVSNNLHRRNSKLQSTGWGHQNIISRFGALTERKVVIEETKASYTVSVPLLIAENRFAHATA